MFYLIITTNNNSKEKTKMTKEEREEMERDQRYMQEQIAEAKAEEKAARYSPSGVSYDSYEGCE